MITLILPLILFSSAADVSSAAINNEINNEFCSFKDGDKNPTFLYNKGGQSVEILCTNETCHCDGSNTGYEGCQKCCCSIRERSEACALVETNEVISVESDDRRKYLIWAIMATVLCVLLAVTGFGAWLYQKRQCDNYRKKAENLRDCQVHQDSIPNGQPNNGDGNTAVILPQQTVFPVVEEVSSETDPRIDQTSIDDVQAVQDEMDSLQGIPSSVISTPDLVSGTQNIPSLSATIGGDVEDEREDENAPLTS